MWVSLAIATMWLYGCAMSSQTYVVRHDPYPAFNSLDGYGQWINVPGLGTVWQPYDENNWQPYADGHWVWTDNGWMWDSNEPYGWIVYHYGYWQFSRSYGWVWIPGYDWQPARVVWYHSNGYVGWAPLPPPGINETEYFSHPEVRVWVIVHEENFIDRDVVRYRDRSVSPDIRELRSRDGGRAPDIRSIERVTRRTIEPVRPVRENIRSGGRDLIRFRVENENTVKRPEPNAPAVLPVKPPEGRSSQNSKTETRTEPKNRNNPEIKRNTPDRGEPVRNENGGKVIRKDQPQKNVIRREPAKRIEPAKKEDVKKREQVNEKKRSGNQNKQRDSRKQDERNKDNGRN